MYKSERAHSIFASMGPFTSSHRVVPQLFFNNIYNCAAAAAEHSTENLDLLCTFVVAAAACICSAFFWCFGSIKCSMLPNDGGELRASGRHYVSTVAGALIFRIYYTIRSLCFSFSSFPTFYSQVTTRVVLLLLSCGDCAEGKYDRAVHSQPAASQPLWTMICCNRTEPLGRPHFSAAIIVLCC